MEMLNHDLFVISSHSLSRSVLVKVDDVLLANNTDGCLVPPVVYFFVILRFGQSKDYLLELLSFALTSDGEVRVFTNTQAFFDRVVFKSFFIADVFK